jgi:phosphopantothenoylcysteine decarboxylase/phosphopantothenate--cysteine ligase
MAPLPGSPQNTAVKTVGVTSAIEMLDNCQQIFPETDIFIAAAAVADYTPAQPSDKKNKKRR